MDPPAWNGGTTTQIEGSELDATSGVYANYFAYDGRGAFTPTSDMTLLFMSMETSFGDQMTLFEGPGYAFNIRTNAPHNRVEFSCTYTGGPTIFTPPNVWENPANAPSAKMFRRKGTEFELWYDGVIEDSAIATLSGTPIIGRTAISSPAGTGVRGYSGNIWRAALWDRALTDEEMYQATWGAWAKAGHTRGWQFPVGYEEYIANRVAPDPDPDPGYGSMRQNYYRIPEITLSHGPSYMQNDPYIRDIRNAIGQELAMARAAVDVVAGSSFVWRCRSDMLERHLTDYQFGTDYRHTGWREGRGDVASKKVRTIGIPEMYRLHGLVTGGHNRLWIEDEQFTNFTVLWFANDNHGFGFPGGLQWSDVLNRYSQAHIFHNLGSAPFTEPATFHWRFRNDDGNETGATWKAAEDVAPTFAVDTDFRLRWTLGCVDFNGGNDVFTAEYRLYWRLEDGDWFPVTDAPESLVKPITSSEYTTPVDTTQQLTIPGSSLIGNFIGAGNDSLIDAAQTGGGAIWDDDGTGIDFVDGSSSTDNAFAELEGAFEIDGGAKGVHAKSGDKVWFRMVHHQEIPGVDQETARYDAAMTTPQNYPNPAIYPTNGIPALAYMIVT